MHIDRALLNQIKHERDIIAAGLSVIPGLGHIYKGYYVPGLIVLLLGIPVIIWIGVLLSLATAGIGLVVPFGAWVMVAIDAYCKKNRRKHHWFGVL